MLNLEMGLYGGNQVEMQSLGWPQPGLAGVLLRGRRRTQTGPGGARERTCLHAIALGGAPVLWPPGLGGAVHFLLPGVWC